MRHNVRRRPPKTARIIYDSAKRVGHYVIAGRSGRWPGKTAHSSRLPRSLHDVIRGSFPNRNTQTESARCRKDPALQWITVLQIRPIHPSDRPTPCVFTIGTAPGQLYPANSPVFPWKQLYPTIAGLDPSGFPRRFSRRNPVIGPGLHQTLSLASRVRKRFCESVRDQERGERTAERESKVETEIKET